MRQFSTACQSVCTNSAAVVVIVVPGRPITYARKDMSETTTLQYVHPINDQEGRCSQLEPAPESTRYESRSTTRFAPVKILAFVTLGFADSSNSGRFLHVFLTTNVS